MIKRFLQPTTYNLQPTRGFTLIELIVSVGLFSFVMVIVGASYLTLINADSRSRASAELVSNISFALETMTRSIKTGVEYRCNGSEDDYCDFQGTTVAQTCFSFTENPNSPKQNTTSYFVDSGVIYRNRVGGRSCSVGEADPITDPSVYVDELTFYVTGAARNYNDAIQSRVVIVVAGHMDSKQGGKTVSVPFSLQTQATQRKNQ